MSDSSPVDIGDVQVGGGAPVVLMPEIGTYFDRDIEQAKATVRQLVAFRVPIVKGEVFHTPEIVADDGQPYTYSTLQGSRTERYRDIVARKVMPFDAWRSLYGILSDAGLPFMISCYDRESVDFCVEIGTAAIKIASNNIHHLPLVRHAGQSGIPVVLDTGRANMSHVALAIEELWDAGCRAYIINHNPEGHPAPGAGHHLRMGETYRRAFGCPVGLSCHYAGNEVLFTAIGAGFDLLEKPVCPDPAQADVDSPWAIALKELPYVLEKTRECWEALGRTYRATLQRDDDNIAIMGLVARKNLPPGAQIDHTTVSFAWPARGIPARDFDRVNGARTVRAIATGKPVRWPDLGLRLQQADES